MTPPPDTAVDGGVEVEELALTGRASRAVRVRRVGLRVWSWRLLAVDAAAIVVAVGISRFTRFGVGPLDAGFDSVLAVALVPGWLLATVFAGAYDRRFIPSGSELYRRVITAGVWLLAVVGFVSFAFKQDPSRQFVLVSIPFAVCLTLLGRYAVRKAMHRTFARGATAHRVLAVGSVQGVSDLVRHLSRTPQAGFKVVAALTPGQGERPLLPAGVQWAGGDPDTAPADAQAQSVDTIALVGSQLPARELRELSWQLEDTDIDLVVAPSLTDVAGPRIRIRPIEGLPLLHIDKPQFTGVHRVVKEAMDGILGIAFLAAAVPLMALIAVAVKLTSRGPVLYRQPRVGLGGKQFELLKFRSMRLSADDLRSDVAHLNQSDVLFKIRHDPRTTPIGRFLRRFSLDELPQLWNVVHGDMSLVGPRPPLPSEVERYAPDMHRRLLVKPGLTGLWQVSGRSDLSWDETMRLDLYYVDHWSVGLDVVLLLKTFVTVLRGRGAY